MERGLSSGCGCAGNFGYPRNGYVQTSREVFFLLGLYFQGFLQRIMLEQVDTAPR